MRGYHVAGWAAGAWSWMGGHFWIEAERRIKYGAPVGATRRGRVSLAPGTEAKMNRIGVSDSEHA